MGLLQIPTLGAGMDLISYATGSGTQLTFSSIPQKYRHLRIIGYWGGLSSFGYFDTNSMSYSGCQIQYILGSTVNTVQDSTARIAYSISDGPVSFDFTIQNYSDTGTTGKLYTCNAAANGGAWSSGRAIIAGGSILQSSSASITQVGLKGFLAGAGYRVSLYGML